MVAVILVALIIYLVAVKKAKSKGSEVLSETSPEIPTETPPVEEPPTETPPAESPEV